MYSYFYDESETWAIWPNHLSLSKFTKNRGAIIISLLMRHFFDGVRTEGDTLKNTVLDLTTELTSVMGELEIFCDNYQKTVEVGNDFVR